MDLEATVTRWARQREDVHAVVLVGSRARTQTPADAWSDYDFVLVVDDAGAFLDSEDWLGKLAPALLSYVEATATGGIRERRVLFADGTDADFSILPRHRLEEVKARPGVAGVFARGYRVLLDAGVLGELPTEASRPAEDRAALAQEFWYRALLTARKLRRGETHVAAMSCNCTMRRLLRRALELEARAAGRDPWHDGRFLERWAEPRRVEQLKRTVALEEPATVAAAIRAACELFEELDGPANPAVSSFINGALG